MLHLSADAVADALAKRAHGHFLNRIRSVGLPLIEASGDSRPDIDAA